MKVAIGQFGAPTTVFNSSLYGVLEGLDHQAEIYAVVGGVSGLVSGQLAPVTDIPALAWMVDAPGAAFSAGRYTKKQEVVEQAVQTLMKAGIDAFVLLGGNGTMGLGAAVATLASDMGYPLLVVGVPKTIDNDIVGIDHAPGFPSAARFVLQAVRDLQIDLEAMVGFEQVRVVEVMGRRSGWLAAASSLLPHIPLQRDLRTSVQMNRHDVPPPIICIPEQPLDLSSLLGQIESRVRDNNNALVVVSEGVLDALGNPVLQAGEKPMSTSAMLGGIGAVMAVHVREELGFGVRYENLGLLQRCWNGCSLQSDKQHAKRLGQMGARAVLAGQSGIMVGLTRSSQGDGSLVESVLQLDDLAGQERRLTGNELLLADDFVRWLGPLVELDSMNQYPRFSPANKPDLPSTPQLHGTARTPTSVADRSQESATDRTDRNQASAKSETETNQESTTD